MTNSSNNWATILAGGEGRRLRTLTRALSGDARPKQFCRLLGQRTLLDETRRRVYMNVEPARTVYVVTRDHEAFYRPELSDVRRWQLIEQPTNRGTTAAVIYTLVRLRALGAEGVVGLFPADHYYTDRLVLQRTVADAYTFADSHPDSVVLLGAEADRPDPTTAGLNRVAPSEPMPGALAVRWPGSSPGSARSRRLTWPATCSPGAACGTHSFWSDASRPSRRSSRRPSGRSGVVSGLCARPAPPTKNCWPPKKSMETSARQDFPTTSCRGGRSGSSSSICRRPAGRNLGQPNRALAVMAEYDQNVRRRLAHAAAG